MPNDDSTGVTTDAPAGRPRSLGRSVALLLAIASHAVTLPVVRAQDENPQRVRDLNELYQAALIADPAVRAERYGTDIDERLRQAGITPTGSFRASGQGLPVNPQSAGRSFIEIAREQDAQEAARLAEQEAVAGAENGDTISLAAFTEPVELTLLLSIAAETLGLNMTVDESLQGTVKFNAPIEVAQDEFLPLLDALLQPRGFTITQDDTGWYTVRRSQDIPLVTANDHTTRIIRTLNVKPSVIDPILSQQLNDPSVRKTPLDELGVLIVTGPKRSLDVAETFLSELIEERGRLRFERIALLHVSAPVARDRAIQLLSGAQGVGAGVRRPGQQNGVQPANAAAAIQGVSGGSLSNLAERLRIDPGDNALFFLGLPEELDEVTEVIDLIDTPSALEPRRYRTGSATANIAQIAEAQGLGSTLQLQSTQPGAAGIGGGRNQPGVQNSNPAAQTAVGSGGSTMITDAFRGYIVYYGTPAQHERFAALVDEFEVADEVVTIRSYRLLHATAEDVATVLNGLINQQTPSGDGTNAFLPQGQLGGNQVSNDAVLNQFDADLGEDDIGAAFVAENTFVIADDANNQLFVKAPQRQQREFERLIQRIDLRRPQVFIEARIVTVNVTDDLDYSVEGTLFEVLGSNFSVGQTTGGIGGAFGAATAIGPTSGFTGVVLNPQQVPVLLNAVRTNSRSRAIASPSILVDDNEEAAVSTVRIEPTLEQSQGQATTAVSVGEPVEAGTSFTLTPQISEGGYIRLNYSINQSEFIGEGTDVLPPPQISNDINSGSVTIPSGSTVIIGGLTVESDARTIIRIPILGDIPILGQLFGSTNKNNTRTRLYVFLTPRILAEPTIEDYRLLTAPALSEVDLPDNEPRLEPLTIPIRVPDTLKNVAIEDLLSEQQRKEYGLADDALRGPRASAR
ncbi:MAG: secretin N-terminal domain-containing protein [Planctomycetota bacterium]